MIPKKFLDKITWMEKQLKCLIATFGNCETGEVIIDHNDNTTGKQGIGPEYYHLNYEQYNKLNNISESIVESVSGDIVDNTDPKNPIVNEAKDLPLDFIVSCKYDSSVPIDNSRGKILLYRIGNTNYELNLLEVLSSVLPSEFPVIHVVHNIGASDNNPNNYVISGNLRSSGGTNLHIRFVATLKGGKLINNKWVVEDVELITIGGTIANYTFHGHTIIGDNVYYMPRYTSSSIQNRIIRYNINNLQDTSTLVLPLSAPYIGNSTNIDNHEGNVYLFITTSSSNPVGTMIRVSGDLNYYETLFTIDGNDTDTGIRADSYFIIDKDEIMIPTVNDVNDTYEKYHTIGLSVYSIDGKLKRKKVGMDLNLGYDPTRQPQSHWIGILNNKMIISYSNGSSGDAPLRLVRLDVGYGNNNSSINLEESVWSFGTTNFTNDNSIDSKGYVYLNPEGVATEKWYKVYYLDFTDVEEIASNYWSLGSPLPKNRKTSEKINLSQFGEWNKVTQSVSVNGGTPITPDPITGNIDLTVSGGGGTWGSIAGTLSDQTDLQTALNGKAAITIYPETTYSEIVTWGGTAPVTMQNSTWQATKIGNRLSLRMNINYATAGTANTTAQVPLPTGVPLPSSITGFTNNNSYIAVGSGVVSTGITSNPVISRAVLRRETATAYSVYNSFSSGTYNTIIIDIEYFTD